MRYFLTLFFLIFSLASLSGKTQVGLVLGDTLGECKYKGFQVAVRRLDDKDNPVWISKVKFTDWSGTVCISKSKYSSLKRSLSILGWASLALAATSASLPQISSYSGIVAEANLEAFSFLGVATTSAALYFGPDAPGTLWSLASKVTVEHVGGNSEENSILFENYTAGPYMTIKNMKDKKKKNGSLEWENGIQQWDKEWFKGCGTDHGLGYWTLSEDEKSLKTFEDFIGKVISLKKEKSEEFPRYILSGNGWRESMNCVSFSVKLLHNLGVLPLSKLLKPAKWYKKLFSPFGSTQPEDILEEIIKDDECRNYGSFFLNKPSSGWHRLKDHSEFKHYFIEGE